jgi:rare lipoprotein A
MDLLIPIATIQSDEPSRSKAPATRLRCKPIPSYLPEIPGLSLGAAVWLLVGCVSLIGAEPSGLASWYGEQHRNRLMANGRPFDPDKLTAASWMYPLGTRLRISTHDEDRSVVVTRGAVRTPRPTYDHDGDRSVVVTVTDRGPARELVRRGRVIDLSKAAFAVLGDCKAGLIRVRIEPLLEVSSLEPDRERPAKALTPREPESGFQMPLPRVSTSPQ